jgi:outer membrane protein assembly factor BamB
VYSRQTNTIFGGSNDGIFYAIDAHTGTLRWVFAAGSEIKSRAALNASETLVAFGCFSGIVFVLDVTTGKLVSSYKAEFAVYSEPCWYNHVLYFSSLDKRLYAYDTEEQVLRWEYCTAGRVFSSPVII